MIKKKEPRYFYYLLTFLVYYCLSSYIISLATSQEKNEPLVFTLIDSVDHAHKHNLKIQSLIDKLNLRKKQLRVARPIGLPQVNLNSNYTYARDLPKSIIDFGGNSPFPNFQTPMQPLDLQQVDGQTNGLQPPISSEDVENDDDYENYTFSNLIDITSKAAISCYPYLGKENKTQADKAATDIMRFNLNNLNIDGEVVIGEGELDEAPMLYIGEKLGKQNGLMIDIAVDPVEGTNFVAKNLPGAISVIAVSKKGNLFKAPETYMNKIAFGKDIPKDVIDLDNSIEKNIKNLSDFKNKNIEDISVCLLKRKRHEKIIDSLKKLGVKIKLINDGDVAGALLVSDEKYDVDIFLGIGGGPEGVIAASALDAMKCNFQGRFIFENDLDKSRAKKMGIIDFNKKYEINEIIKGDSIFCATGITNGDLINGIKKVGKYFHTETFVTHKSQNLVQKINKKYILE